MSGSWAIHMKNPSICWLTGLLMRVNRYMAGTAAPEAHIQASQVCEAGDTEIEVQYVICGPREHLSKECSLSLTQYHP